MIKKYFFNLFAQKKNGFLFIMIALVALVAASFKKDINIKNEVYINHSKDSLLSKKAFLKVYSVLMSPRCMNCHPSGDAPLQGDDNKLHTQLVKRGADGKGIYAMKCINCHMDQNTVGANMPPGNPNWKLPSAEMKLVFQGKSARQLAAQLLNTKYNGNKSKQELVQHISADGLVLWAWNPGDGRKAPPMSHTEFVKQFKLWIDSGAYLPD